MSSDKRAELYSLLESIEGDAGVKAKELAKTILDETITEKKTISTEFETFKTEFSGMKEALEQITGEKTQLQQKAETLAKEKTETQAEKMTLEEQFTNLQNKFNAKEEAERKTEVVNFLIDNMDGARSNKEIRTLAAGLMAEGDLYKEGDSFVFKADGKTMAGAEAVEGIKATYGVTGKSGSGTQGGEPPVAESNAGKTVAELLNSPKSMPSFR